MSLLACDYTWGLISIHKQILQPVNRCPVDCIHEAGDQLYIDPNECIDCGLCEPECPVDAIFMEDEVPDQWKNFIQINADFAKK